MNINEVLVLAAITVFAAWFALRFTALKSLSHRTGSHAHADGSPLAELPYTSFQANRRVDLRNRPI